MAASVEAEEHAHELVYHVVGLKDDLPVLGVGQGQRGDVRGLGAPHGPGHGAEEDAEGDHEEVARVEIGGDVDGEEAEGEDHGPLGGQSIDEPWSHETREDRGSVDDAQGNNPEAATRVQAALKTLEERFKEKKTLLKNYSTDQAQL